MINLLLLYKLTFVFVSALELGQPLPMSATKMQNVDGHRLSIGEIKGERGTLVFFGSNVCQMVKAWDDRIKALGTTYQPKGIATVMINSNSGGDESLEAMKKKTYPFPYLKDDDGKVAEAFSAKTTPAAYVFNKRNQLVYRGTIDDNATNAPAVKAHYLRDALEAVLKNKKVKTETTDLIGSPIVARATESK
ncbi:MAG: redoxin domain-containing protein [Bdellovibrionia bacterium]